MGAVGHVQKCWDFHGNATNKNLMVYITVLLVVLFENRVPRMAIILGSTSCVDLPIHLSRFFFTSFVGVHLVAFAALRVDCHDRLVAGISSRSSR